MKQVFALCDCDSFYASCEKIFRPDLWHAPVVVLSNNDGFIIAASKEAKALGYKTIEKPYFQLEDQLKRDKVAILSANFELYGDISNRVFLVLSRFTPDIEVYSIDECFLLLGAQKDNLEFARLLRETVWNWVGVPVSIGIGHTKTLAKVATRWAKKHPECKGVFDLTNHSDVDSVLDKVPVSDIWGVGRQYASFLEQNNISTAKQLKYSPIKWAKQHMTVMGQRTVEELRGKPCFMLGHEPSAKKSILRSRSFGRLVYRIEDLNEALSAYTERACEQLRSQHSLTYGIQIFVTTNPHKNEPQYSNAVYSRLSMPTANTSTMIKIAHHLLEKIYKPGYRYLKAGVILFDIIDESLSPNNLFKTPYHLSKEYDLMKTVDRINNNYGPRTVTMASSGLEAKPWSMRQSSRSPRYTTRLSELREVG